jgi:CRISPR/Cas system-associated endonuclease Cas1
VESKAKIIEVMLNYGPALLEELVVKSIWAWGLVCRQFLYDVIKV